MANRTNIGRLTKPSTKVEIMRSGGSQYAEEVKARTFPGDEHTYRKKE